MKKEDDAKARQAMLEALAAYTGPIPTKAKAVAKPETKTCKLSEFGECQREFVPAKKWAEFCCTEHRKRWHYLDRNPEAQHDERMNGHATNGHDHAKPKRTLAELGLAQPKPGLKHRKLTNAVRPT